MGLSQNAFLAVSKDFVEVFSLSFPISLFFTHLFLIRYQPNIIMQGCRALLLDKDKNPKVILEFNISYFRLSFLIENGL